MSSTRAAEAGPKLNRGRDNYDENDRDMKVDFRYLFPRLALVVLGLMLGTLLFGVGYWICRISTDGIVAGSADRPAIVQQLEKTPYDFDDVLSYRLRPNYTGLVDREGGGERSTNSMGVIGPEGEPDPSRDVLILGDSVAYGYHLRVEDTFASMLSTPDRKVWNASCPGWTTFQEVEFYNRYLAKIGTWRHVLLCVCLNDLTRFEWVHKNGKYDMQEWSIEWQQRSTSETNSLTLASFSDPGLTQLKSLHAGFLDAWNPARWNAHFFSHVLPLSQKCRLTVMVVPLRSQCSAAGCGGDPDLVFWPQRHLEKWCVENQISYLDLYPCTEGLVGAHWDECHFHARAHARIASRLREYLDAK